MTQSNEMNQPRPEKEEVRKERYESPTLRSYGSLKELTHFVGNDGLDPGFAGTRVTT